jgi:hypothetical protein
MDLQTLKRMTGFANTTKHDDYLSEMLPVMIEYVKDSGIPFNDDIPAGVKLFIAKAIQFNMNSAGLKGRSMGEVSYSYNTDFPRSVTSLLNPYRRATFR